MSDGVTSIDKLPTNPQGNTNSSQPVQQQLVYGAKQNDSGSPSFLRFSIYPSFCAC